MSEKNRYSGFKGIMCEKLGDSLLSQKKVSRFFMVVE